MQKVQQIWSGSKMNPNAFSIPQHLEEERIKYILVFELLKLMN